MNRRGFLAGLGAALAVTAGVTRLAQSRLELVAEKVYLPARSHVAPKFTPGDYTAFDLGRDDYTCVTTFRMQDGVIHVTDQQFMEPHLTDPAAWHLVKRPGQQDPVMFHHRRTKMEPFNVIYGSSS